MGLFDLFKDKKKEIGFSLRMFKQSTKRTRDIFDSEPRRNQPIEAWDQVRLIFVLDTVLRMGVEQSVYVVELTEIHTMGSSKDV